MGPSRRAPIRSLASLDPIWTSTFAWDPLKCWTAQTAGYPRSQRASRRIVYLFPSVVNLPPEEALGRSCRTDQPLLDTFCPSKTMPPFSFTNYLLTCYEIEGTIRALVHDGEPTLVQLRGMEVRKEPEMNGCAHPAPSRTNGQVASTANLRQVLNQPTLSESFIMTNAIDCLIVGSCETESSSDGKQSFAVLSSFSFDSQEHLDMDTKMKATNIRLPNSARMAETTNMSHTTENGHFQTFPHSKRINEGADDTKEVDNTLSKTESDPKEAQGNDLHFSHPPDHPAAEHTSAYDAGNLKPSRDTVESLQDSAPTVDSRVNECRPSSLNDTADDVSSVHTEIKEEEKPQHSTDEHQGTQKEENQQEEAQRGPHQPLQKKGSNMLSEILNILDGANQGTSNSPLPIMINSETESNAGGFHGRSGGCELINKVGLYSQLWL